MIIRGKTYTVEEIIRGVGDCHYVSFDIFDTLVKRCVAKPSDVFARVIKDYNRLHQRDLDSEEFCSLRILAGKTASQEVWKAGREERTLAEIYKELDWKYGDVCQELMRLEIEREIACCKQNPVMKKVFDWCIESDKKVYVTSDMYLPRKVIEQILENCGYKGYHELFLSSEYNKRKQSGSLYWYIITKERLKRKDFVHIGDHFKIDYINAKKYGLNAVKIPRNIKRHNFKRNGIYGQKDSRYKKIQQVIGNFSQQDWSPYKQYGFECIGPMLYGFCTWLHRRAKEEGCRKLFFLSRDGFMMQQAYQTLYGVDALPNSYMYASRKSLFGPQVWMNPDLEDILKQETPYHYWDVDELCEMLDVNKEYGHKEWTSGGLALDERLMKKELFTDQRVSSFFEAVKPKMIEASKSKFNVVIDYFKQECLKGNVGIVDVGWAGAIQRYMQRFSEKANLGANIYGFYLGLKPVTVTGPKADAYIPQSEQPSMFCSNLMEYPFTKEEGSTKGYQRKIDGGIEPVLADYEFEGMEDKSYTHSMQEGAMYFIELMRDGYGIQDVDWRIGYHNVKNATKSPRIKDVVLLGGLSHVNHGRRVFLAKPDGRWNYLCHPRRLKMDFIDSGWKIGFLKKLFVLSLPYNKLLKLIRK